MLDKLPSFISLLGVFILGASVSYDFGFFYVLGTSFSEMPTTLSDHLRSSLNWIPVGIMGIWGLFIYEMFNRRVEQGMTEEELLRGTSHPKLIAWLRKLPVYFIMLLAASPVIQLFIGVEILISQWILFVTVYWGLFITFVFGHERIRQQTSLAFRVASYVIPTVLMTLAFYGGSNAQRITKGGGTQYVFDLRETQRETKIVGTLARSFEKYHLIWDKSKKEIRLVNVNEVVQFYPQSKTANSDQKSPSTSR